MIRSRVVGVRTMTGRMLLCSAAFFLVVACSTANAQTTTTPVTLPNYPPPGPVPPVGPYSPYYQTTYFPMEQSRTGCSTCDTGSSKMPRVKRFLNDCGLGCWGHHDHYGCGSCWAQTRFVFGSCRAFFGEPCALQPPRIPTPDGYEPPVPPQGTPPNPRYLQPSH